MSKKKEILFEVPEHLRKEMLECATAKQVSIDWLVNIYRQGFNAQLGATGAFPYGKSAPDDEGELTVGLATDVSHGLIRMAFGKPVKWLALSASHARHLAKMLLQKADELDKRLS